MFYSVSPQGAQIIAFQECGPNTARLVRDALGPRWDFAQSGSEDPVATFWDGGVFRIAQHETLSVFPDTASQDDPYRSWRTAMLAPPPLTITWIILRASPHAAGPPFLST